MKIHLSEDIPCQTEQADFLGSVCEVTQYKGSFGKAFCTRFPTVLFQRLNILIIIEFELFTRNITRNIIMNITRNITRNIIRNIIRNITRNITRITLGIPLGISPRISLGIPLGISLGILQGTPLGISLRIPVCSPHYETKAQGNTVDPSG